MARTAKKKGATLPYAAPELRRSCAPGISSGSQYYGHSQALAGESSVKPSDSASVELLAGRLAFTRLYDPKQPGLSAFFERTRHPAGIEAAKQFWAGLTRPGTPFYRWLLSTARESLAAKCHAPQVCRSCDQPVKLATGTLCIDCWSEVFFQLKRRSNARWSKRRKAGV